MLALYNAHIHSQSSKYPHATALLIHQGRILAMGSDDEVLSIIGGKFTSQNMEDRTIWPGLTDAHLHLQHYLRYHHRHRHHHHLRYRRLLG